MRKYFILAWCCVFVAMCGFDERFGPLLELHQAARIHAAVADRSMRAEDFTNAASEYGKMLGILPDNAAHRTARLQLELAIDHAGAKSGHQVESIQLLDDALARADGDPAIAPAVLNDVRRELGMLHYYDAWLMRLQHAPTPLWTAEAERARQQFKLLAKTEENTANALPDAMNVERVIRLEQFDLSVLRGMKLPKQASGLNSKPTAQNQTQMQERTKPQFSGRKVKPIEGVINRPGGSGGGGVHALRGS